MPHLSIFAGKKAMQHILREGLSPIDVDCVMGASGAAKWLAIAGLDKAVFGHWLAESRHEIALYGTSVGAFKLAAAAHLDPIAALDRLASAYIQQKYEKSVDADSIAVQMEPVIDSVAGAGAAEQVLNHTNFRLQIGAVRCVDRQLASSSIRQQQSAMVRMFFANAMSRKKLSRFVHRARFYDPRLGSQAMTGSQTKGVSHRLSTDNFRQSLIASGSLPIYMHAVSDIDGAHSGVYRDGGLLDYHPLPQISQRSISGSKLVLYPHFYPRLTEGWFDKFLPWREIAPELKEDIVLMSPSKEYIASLEGKAIPSRQDFQKFRGRDEQRMRRWTDAVNRSDELGEQFISWAKSGDIAEHVKPL